MVLVVRRGLLEVRFTLPMPQYIIGRLCHQRATRNDAWAASVFSEKAVGIVLLSRLTACIITTFRREAQELSILRPKAHHAFHFSTIEPSYMSRLEATLRHSEEKLRSFLFFTPHGRIMHFIFRQ